ncbi:MAG: hypothetical protein GEU75_16735 [Dehalococcoidia bacterium]|nr:hypothetical protein [Dehalococcoidia bacterium]
MIFEGLRRSFFVNHGHGDGHFTAFATRADYLTFLRAEGITEEDLLRDPDLVKAVYLDWLRRGQVGCVFAQLLSRPANREHVRTLVLMGSATDPAAARELAQQIDTAFKEAVAATGIEALSLLLPQLTQSEGLVYLTKALEELNDWKLESILPWRDTTTIIGVRALIEKDGEDETWAEILGMGPFPNSMPPTRLCPITSVEIRTKTLRRRASKVNPGATSGHLADIPSELFLGARSHKRLFDVLTPALKLRILGGTPDDRAKASVTFSVPTPMWKGLSLNS